MISILREDTGQCNNFTYQPHLYYVNDKGKLVWFQVGDYSRGLDKFSKPISFDKRGRKFTLIGKVPEEYDEVTIEVKGSNGQVYQVDPNKKTCTCTGFKYHGKCKHLKSIV